MQFMMEDRKGKTDGESGYVLLAVIFLTVILLISIALAAPKIAQSIQRDRDLETIHRGEQYKRAIQLYYKQYGAYPTSFDQLKQTNNVRYLRKEYADPLTGKVDWKPVYYGQAHVHPLGFFGQPLSAIGGVGAASAVLGGASSGMYAIAAPTTTDANGVPVADTSGGDASGTDSSSSGFGSSSSGFGSSSSGSSGFGSSSFGSSSSGSSGFGPSSSGGAFSTGQQGEAGTGLSGYQSNGSSLGGSSAGGSSAFGSSTSGTPGTGTSATTFGGAGGPIVGVTLAVNKPSLIDYKLQTRYNKWEFNYDPMEEQMTAGASLIGGSAADASGTSTGTGTTNGVFGNNGATGAGNNGSNIGFGTSNGTSGGTGNTGSGSPGSGSPNNPNGSSPQ
jgi:type II secretory pathway pseudopilin PulG